MGKSVRLKTLKLLRLSSQNPAQLTIPKSNAYSETLCLVEDPSLANRFEPESFTVGKDSFSSVATILMGMHLTTK